MKIKELLTNEQLRALQEAAQPDPEPIIVQATKPPFQPQYRGRGWRRARGMLK